MKSLLVFATSIACTLLANTAAHSDYYCGAVKRGWTFAHYSKMTGGPGCFNGDCSRSEAVRFANSHHCGMARARKHYRADGRFSG